MPRLATRAPKKITGLQKLLCHRYRERVECNLVDLECGRETGGLGFKKLDEISNNYDRRFCYEILDKLAKGEASVSELSQQHVCQ